MDFEISQIETMTDHFSKNLKVGSGGFADVYKGWYDGKHIAVKRLRDPLRDLDGNQFKSEFNKLTNVSHKNVVRIIGCCCESRSKYEKHNGENICVESLERVLCFEYMEGGSLEKHIKDGPCELDWPMCYNIIIGISEGLNHLHNAQEKPIFHLDLKPANILLDKSMMPKIADLGLSRVFSLLETHETKKITGTTGYMPPEFIDRGAISNKNDVFSLGVIIIQMLDGHEGYHRCYDVSSKQFIDLVSQKWAKRLQAMPGPNSSHEMDILRVSRCAEIALRCIDKDRKKRPSIQDIVRELDQSPSLQRPTDAGCKMLSSRLLKIANNQPQYWRWISLPDSRFPECAELLSVYFFAVIGEVPPEDLSPDTSYVVYLVYKLTSSTSGLRGCVQTASLRLYGERIVPGSTCKVSLDPEAHESASDVTYPVARGDGWLELRLAEFENDEAMQTEQGVIVDLREEDVTVQKRGLIVAGMEFRSN